MTTPTVDDPTYRMAQAKAFTGLSRATIYRMIKRKEFPQPIPLGAQAVGWPLSVLQAWRASRLTASPT